MVVVVVVGVVAVLARIEEDDAGVAATGTMLAGTMLEAIMAGAPGCRDIAAFAWNGLIHNTEPVVAVPLCCGDDVTTEPDGAPAGAFCAGITVIMGVATRFAAVCDVGVDGAAAVTAVGDDMVAGATMAAGAGENGAVSCC